MVEYLEKLVEDREFEKALVYAEQLLFNRDVTVRDLMIINAAMLYARQMLGEYYGAAIPGRLSLRLARDLEDWNRHGLICLNLSFNCINMGDYQEAVDLCYEFLSNLNYYSSSRRYEFQIWYNLGLAQNKMGNGKEAVKTFLRAIDVAQALDNHRFTHGIRHALVGAYVTVKDYRPIPALLAKCLHYLRHNPDSADNHESKLWHFVLRTEFGIATKRYKRAEKIALCGLRIADGYQLHRHLFHMLLARIHHGQGDLTAALGHALSARIYAIRIRRYDLELVASEAMYSITAKQPGSIDEISPENWIPFLELGNSDSLPKN